jgi:hypothetical protein
VSPNSGWSSGGCLRDIDVRYTRLHEPMLAIDDTVSVEEIRVGRQVDGGWSLQRGRLREVVVLDGMGRDAYLDDAEPAARAALGLGPGQRVRADQRQALVEAHNAALMERLGIDEVTRSEVEAVAPVLHWTERLRPCPPEVPRPRGDGWLGIEGAAKHRQELRNAFSEVEGMGPICEGRTRFSGWWPW